MIFPAHGEDPLSAEAPCLNVLTGTAEWCYCFWTGRGESFIKSGFLPKGHTD